MEEFHIVDTFVETAQFADRWLGVEVGTDIALANTIAREIIHAGLAHDAFITNATVGFDQFAESVDTWTLDRGSDVTGVPPDAISELAHAYATAETSSMTLLRQAATKPIWGQRTVPDARPQPTTVFEKDRTPGL